MVLGFSCSARQQQRQHPVAGIRLDVIGVDVERQTRPHGRTGRPSAHADGRETVLRIFDGVSVSLEMRTVRPFTWTSRRSSDLRIHSVEHELSPLRKTLTGGYAPPPHSDLPQPGAGAVAAEGLSPGSAERAQGRHGYRAMARYSFAWQDRLASQRSSFASASRTSARGIGSGVPSNHLR